MLADLLSAIRGLVDEARAPRTLEWGDPRKVLVFKHGAQGAPDERERPGVLLALAPSSTSPRVLPHARG